MNNKGSNCETKKAAKRALQYLNVNRNMMALKGLYWSDMLFHVAQEHNELAARGGSAHEAPEGLPHNSFLAVEVLDSDSTDIETDELMSKFLTQYADNGNDNLRLFNERHTHGAVALQRCEHGVLMTVVLHQDPMQKV